MSDFLKILITIFLLICSFFSGFYFKWELDKTKISKEKNKIHRIDINKKDNILNFTKSPETEIYLNNKILTGGSVNLK